MTVHKKELPLLNERVAVIETNNTHLYKSLEELKQGQKDIIKEMKSEFIDIRSEMRQGFSEMRQGFSDVRKESWSQMRWMMGFMLTLIASPYIAPALMKFIKILFAAT